VSYTYDELNRLETVSIDWLSRTATYSYDNAGRLTGLTQLNGTVVSYTYDGANRLTGLANRVSTGGSIIASYSFVLDGNGNRTDVVQQGSLPLGIEASSISYNYNTTRNRLVSAGSVSFGYDDEGQLASGYGTAYTFDDAHRLTAIGTSYGFTYNGAGDRIRVVRNGTETRYVYDASGNLIAEADANNVIQKYYIYGAGLLAMVTASNDLYCYHLDATGNTVALTNSAGAIVNKYAYTPFGTLSGNSIENIYQPFKFVGQYGVMTEPNGLYYMRARYYDPNVGRFISEDPIGFDSGDTNLYAYVKNNPIMGVDPDGLFTWYYGGSAAAYYGNKGNATAGAGSIGYSNEAGWFGGNYFTYGAEKAKVDSVQTTVGAGAGVGPVMGFFTGPLSGFQGATRNVTVEVFGIGVTYSNNDSGWGLSVSTGGKGIGLGYYINTTTTSTVTKCTR